jgi:sec-independent protein translocase protein TatA
MFATTPLFVGGIGPTELIVVLALVILLFGANKLPELARASGQAMGEFQRGREELEAEIRTTTRVDADEAVETEPDVRTA